MRTSEAEGGSWSATTSSAPEDRVAVCLRSGGGPGGRASVSPRTMSSSIGTPKDGARSRPHTVAPILQLLDASHDLAEAPTILLPESGVGVSKACNPSRRGPT
jgi:hypothetical protein